MSTCSALKYAKVMGRVLSIAKDVLYDCDVMVRKLCFMIQSTGKSIDAVKKNTFLIQYVSKAVLRSLECLPLHIASDC